MTRHRRLLQSMLVLMLLAGSLYIAWNVPYTHDDWDWGLPIGLERWGSGALNHRYAGTAFALAMTRSPVIKTLVMGLSMLAVGGLVGRLAGGKDRRHWFALALLAFTALTAMPMATWRQTYGWVSAFANFVVAAVVLLVILLMWRRCLEEDEPKWAGAVLLPLCVCAQLFVENLTICLGAAAVVISAYALWRKRGRRAALCSLVGCMVGGWVMFYTPMYAQLFATGSALEGVRQLALPSDAGVMQVVGQMAQRFFADILPALFQAHPAVLALACGGCLKRLRCRRAPKWQIVAAGLWMVGYCAYVSWVAAMTGQTFGWTVPWPMENLWAAVIQLGLMLIILMTDPHPRRWQRVLLLLGAVGLMLPFAAITEMGQRCCYLSCVLLALLGTALLSDHKCSRNGFALLALAAVMVLGFYCKVYWEIGGCEALRQQQLAQAVRQGAQSVLLPTEGAQYAYSWGRNPQADWRAVYYRQFYGLPDELELIFLPRGSYAVWPQISQEMRALAVCYP